MLLQLPDSCLLAVLQFCADDPRSLFSAARAHSSLHAAAVASLHNTTASVRPQQLQSLLLYLSRHGQHMHSSSSSPASFPILLSLTYSPRRPLGLFALPASLQLSSLSFHGFVLQLQPNIYSEGVLHTGWLLRQLVLRDCALQDGTVALKAALLQMPQLEHLDVSNTIRWFPGM